MVLLTATAGNISMESLRTIHSEGIINSLREQGLPPVDSTIKYSEMKEKAIKTSLINLDNFINRISGYDRFFQY